MASFYDLLAPSTGPNPSAVYDVYDRPDFGMSPVLTPPSQVGAGMGARDSGWTRLLSTLLKRDGQGVGAAGGLQPPVAPSAGGGPPTPKPIQNIDISTLVSLAGMIFGGAGGLLGGLGGAAGGAGAMGGGAAMGSGGAAGATGGAGGFLSGLGGAGGAGGGGGFLSGLLPSTNAPGSTSAPVFGGEGRLAPPAAGPPTLARPLIPQQQTTLASPRRFG